MDELGLQELANKHLDPDAHPVGNRAVLAAIRELDAEHKRQRRERDAEYENYIDGQANDYRKERFQLRDANDALTKRLEEARGLIARFETEYLAGLRRLELLDDYRAFLASGSSTVAPSPSPTTCDGLIGSLRAPCTKPRNHGGACEHDARASGSSTGEAKCGDCDGRGIAPSNPILADGRECGGCDGTGIEPAAPEPAPALTWPPFSHAFVPGRLVTDMCGHVVGKGRDGDDIVCAIAADEHQATPARFTQADADALAEEMDNAAPAPNETCHHRLPGGQLCGQYRDSAWHRHIPASMFPGHAFAAAPASAQGTTEPKSEDLSRPRDERDLWAAIEALDKRVSALETVTRNLTAVIADLIPVVPPQPAPVERHAFVLDSRTVHHLWSRQECAVTGCGGQPRSAAVHK